MQATSMKFSRNLPGSGIQYVGCGRIWLLIPVVCLVALGACRQDMHNQPKYIPLRDSDFFKDTSSARPLVEDTVARGTLQDDAAFYTGKQGTTELDTLPFPLTEGVLDRGEQRFNIYCTPCHDRTGSGQGMIVRRGYRQPPTFHIDRLRQAPLGHFFDVMTNGFGAMPDYKAQIAPRDRWAIAAYIRALQLSQHAAVADVPAEDRPKLSQPASAPSEGTVKR
jgi:mono/diheme cytochrome c family protein